jgi:non-homologous end joining protein Ku
MIGFRPQSLATISLSEDRHAYCRNWVVERSNICVCICAHPRIHPFSFEMFLLCERSGKAASALGWSTFPLPSTPPTRREELKFRLLRAKDLSPVNYKRVAEKDGKEVPWDDIVKGYEYEKGKYVVLKDEDFQRVDLEATQTVDIQDFVDQQRIDPIFFYKPYYLEPQKGGDKAYVLLRETLRRPARSGSPRL